MHSKKSDNEIIKRKSEGLRKLTTAYSNALKAGTVRKVVSLAKV